MDNKFKGVFPALLTPFKADSSINDDSVAKLVEYNIGKGVNGFYVGGSTGEGLLLTIEERKQLFKAAAEANAGRTTMIAHVGAICTDHAVELAKYAKEVGYDAISAVAPFYYAFSYEAIKNYYLDIVDSVDVPMIIYNFPNASGFSFTKAIAEELFAASDRFIGIKHTTSDLFMLQQFKGMSANPVVYNGWDEMFIAGLSMGADGGIGSTYNLMADKFIDIYNYFLKGDLRAAQAKQLEANAIISELIKYGTFAAEKAVLDALGIPMGDCRRPFRPISDEGRAKMAQIAKSL
ncbi:MAG: N-acetylneuraminate lyase [Clostridia bacterium]|nr:N-acetylneuraminate lyase [Clostridia bacterium]